MYWLSVYLLCRPYHRLRLRATGDGSLEPVGGETSSVYDARPRHDLRYMSLLAWNKLVWVHRYPEDAVLPVRCLLKHKPRLVAPNHPLELVLRLAEPEGARFKPGRHVARGEDGCQDRVLGFPLQFLTENLSYFSERHSQVYGSLANVGVGLIFEEFLNSFDLFSGPCCPTTRGERAGCPRRFKAPNEPLERFELRNTSGILREEFQPKRPADIAQVLDLAELQYGPACFIMAKR